MKRRHLNPLPLLPILIAPFILLSPVLLTGKALFWGTPSLQFVPWRAYAWDILSAGHLPLWNPLLGMGAPLIANYQSALFYPPNWLYFLLDALGGIGWAAWGQALIVALHLAWAGIGMAILIRRLGLGVLAQTITGLAFGLSGYLVSRAGFLSINAAVAWFPWVLLAVFDLVMFNQRSSTREEPSEKDSALRLYGVIKRIQWGQLKRFAILAIILALQLLAGHAQTAWYTLIMAGMWVGYLGWVNAHSLYLDNVNGYIQKHPGQLAWLYLSEISRAWVKLALAFVLALALAALQLLPTGEYLLHSQRSTAVEFDLAMTYSFWPWRLLSLITPDVFGNPVAGDYWGYGYYWEDALYIGMLPIIFTLVEVVALFWRSKQSNIDSDNESNFIKRPCYRNSLVIFLLIVTCLSFTLALGKNTPFFPWLYNNVPSFSMFQAPTRYTLWAEFALVMLAGFGVDAWRHPSRRGQYWIRLSTAGAFAVAIGAGLTWYLLGDVNPTFIRASAWAGMLGVGIGVLALTNPRPRVPSQDNSRTNKLQVWQWAVILFVAVDLIIAGWGLNQGIDLEFYTEPAPTASDVQLLSDGLRLYLPDEVEGSLKFDRFKRSDSFDPGEDWQNLRAIMLPNLSILDSISSSNNFDPLVPGRYARWMEALRDTQVSGNNFSRNNILNLMGVSVVENMDYFGDGYGVRFDPVEGSALLRWVPCARVAKSEEDAWVQVFEEQIDFEKEVVLEGLNGEQITDCFLEPLSEFGLDFTRSSKNPNRLYLNSETTYPGWLVLSNVWYPGWKVKVDGISTPILRANYLFQAVFIDPGVHEITFVYRPNSFLLGLMISCLAWMLLFVGWRVGR